MDHSRSDAIHAHMCALEAMKLYNSKELNRVCPDLVNPYFVKNFTIGGRSSGKTQYRDTLIELNSLERRTNMNFKKLYGGPISVEYKSFIDTTDILDKVLKTFKKRGRLYVGDLCEIVYGKDESGMCGVVTDTIDWKNGWTNLDKIQINAYFDSWRITFPEVVSLKPLYTTHHFEAKNGIIYVDGVAHGLLAEKKTESIIMDTSAIMYNDRKEHVFLNKKMNVPEPEKKILSLLDIEELSASGEEFQLKRDGMWTRYKIKNQTFMYYNILDDSFRNTTRPLSEILNLEFRRLLPEKPWKPKYGEIYFYLFINKFGEQHACSTNFCGDLIDLGKIATGNFFKTEVEAIKDKTIKAQFEKMKDEFYSK